MNNSKKWTGWRRTNTTDQEIAEVIRTALLAHGAEAVYGQVDWTAIAGDVLDHLGYTAQDAS